MQSKPGCDNAAWQAASLKLLHERPFASLFLDSIDQTVFDPTGLEHVNNIYYVVFNRQGSLCASLPGHEQAALAGRRDTYWTLELCIVEGDSSHMFP